jgi:hypothetical protein
MKNFLYTTGIFLLLLSPATCNYEDNSLLRTEADATIVDESLDAGTENIGGETTLTTECITDVDGDPIIKPRKP